MTTTPAAARHPGHPSRLRSPGLRDREPRYHITVGGGASRLSVTAEAPRQARTA